MAHSQQMQNHIIKSKNQASQAIAELLLIQLLRDMNSAKSEKDNKNTMFTATVPLLDSLQESSMLSSESQAEFPIGIKQQDQNFNLLPSSRPSQQSLIEERTIRRSMVNRSCIRTNNYSCKNLLNIPAEIRAQNALALNNVQKIDLSFNSLTRVDDLVFQKLTSLKEILLNDNLIVDLPYLRINQCKGLRLINISNNNIQIIYPLDKVVYLLARGNPLKLVTAELTQLSFQFVTFDWLQYLVQLGNEGDNFKAFAKEYSLFKKHILAKIDFSKQQNRKYCDFHCFFTAKLQSFGANEDRSKKNLFSTLIAKSVMKNDSFFIGYLRNFHNQLNYGSLVYNCRLLLEPILEANNSDAQQLFKLRRLNYSELCTQQVYFESVRLCCQYSNYDFFKYLISLKQRRKSIQNSSCLSILIHQVLHRYNKQKQSDSILLQLIKIYQQIAQKPIVIKLPSQYNHRLFKSMSQAALDIYNSSSFRNLFEFIGEGGRTTPLHFAMKSRNQQFVRVLLREGQDVLAACQTGTSCKFAAGSTQISRKMIWKREKQIIRKRWNSIENPVFEHATITTEQIKRNQKKKSVSAMIETIVPYEDLQSSFLTYRKPQQLSISKLELTSSCIWKKESYKQQLLIHLSSKVLSLSQLIQAKQYRKKIIYTDIAIFLLHKILQLNQEQEQQAQIFRKLQSWCHLSENLASIFENSSNNDLVGLQILQTLQSLTIGGTSSVKIQKASSYISGSNFWCCQNTNCE